MLLFGLKTFVSSDLKLNGGSRKNVRLQPKTDRNSETVRDRAKIAISH